MKVLSRTCDSAQLIHLLSTHVERLFESFDDARTYMVSMGVPAAGQHGDILLPLYSVETGVRPAPCIESDRTLNSNDSPNYQEFGC